MVADTVRQRQQFEKKVKALTAQGRMSAYVLIAMPFLMALAIFAINPGTCGSVDHLWPHDDRYGLCRWLSGP